MGQRNVRDLTDLMALAKRSGSLVEAGTPRCCLRAAAWEHPLHGIVRPAGVALSEVDARVSTAVAAMTQHCVLGGWASGWVQDVLVWDGYDRWGRARDALVHCLPGSQLRRRKGIRPSESLVLSGELTTAFGVAVTTLVRATFDELCSAKNLTEAVVALDGALCVLGVHEPVTVAGIRALADRHHKRRGIVRARTSLDLGSDRALSPWETRLRIRALYELPVESLLANVPVFSRAGMLLGVPDLLDPESGLVLESDGAQHRDQLSHADDNEREELFEHSGLTVIRFGAIDHRDRFAMSRRIRNGHTRACARTRAAADWTLAIPDWWHGSELARRWRWP